MAEDRPQFEVAYAGSYPDQFAATDAGRWFTATVRNNPVGVVWTNDKKGFGFIPADSDLYPDATRAIDSFRILGEIGGQQSLTASVAFEAAKQLEGFSFEDEQSGKLQGALDMASTLDQPAVTAGALPEGATVVPEGDSLCVTVDQDGNVLELIYSNADGIYVRDNGEWTLVDTSVDQPTIDDQEWFDVTPEFVPVYDDLVQTQDSITRDEVVPYGADRG